MNTPAPFASINPAGTSEAYMGFEPAPFNSAAKPPSATGAAPANDATPAGIPSIAPQPQVSHVQNLEAYGVPSANVAPTQQFTSQPEITDEQKRLLQQTIMHQQLMQLGQQTAKEQNLLFSHLNEQQFKAIATEMSANHVHQENSALQFVVAEISIASMMALNSAIKLHIAYPQVPVKEIVTNVMNIVDGYKKQRPADGLDSVPAQFAALEQAYVQKLGAPQLQPASAANQPAQILTPQGLQQAPAAMTMAANSNISATTSQHQGTVVPQMGPQIA